MKQIFHFNCPLKRRFNEDSDTDFSMIGCYGEQLIIIPDKPFTQLDVFCKICNQVACFTPSQVSRGLVKTLICECGCDEFHAVEYTDLDGLKLTHWATLCSKCNKTISSHSNYD